MKLIKQMIEKMLSKYNDYLLNKKYLKAISMFYCCYNLSLSVLGKKEDLNRAKKRDNLFKKLFFKDINNKKFKILNEFFNEDMKVIIEAMNQLNIKGDQGST